MKERRSSREVVLPKMSFRLGAMAEMKRNAFFLLIYEGNAFISAQLGQVGPGGAGSDCRFKGFRLGATADMKRNAFCLEMVCLICIQINIQCIVGVYTNNFTSFSVVITILRCTCSMYVLPRW